MFITSSADLATLEDELGASAEAFVDRNDPRDFKRFSELRQLQRVARSMSGGGPLAQASQFTVGQRVEIMSGRSVFQRGQVSSINNDDIRVHCDNGLTFQTSARFLKAMN